VNLSDSELPAHIQFKWPHIVFANLKRLGTFHGFREKHLDAYLNEFVFRWNRRRNFRGTFDMMLSIGQRVGPVTYHSIVGDTREWKRERIEDLLGMCHPSKRQIIKDLASYYRVPRLTVLEELPRWVARLKDEDPEAYLYGWSFAGVRELEDRSLLVRTRSTVLARRRPGEERRTDRRYPNPRAAVPGILPRPTSASGIATG
jgi:hypothetical protein